MSLLSELNTLLAPVLPVETGVFSGVPPDEYAVITPMSDTFPVNADDAPQVDVQEARISVYSKKNYLLTVRAIVEALFAADITVTARLYIGFETNTGYHHYAVDAAQFYTWEV